MKKVIAYIFFTILIVVFADIIVGIASTYYVKNHDLPGRYQPLDKLIKKVDTDVLLIGNSAIENSINPDIIQDSLGMSCYNGGIEGQGIFFFETMIDCALQRYSPKVIVLGFRPEELGKRVGDGIYDVLRPYYHVGFPSIDEHFNNAAPNERFLLQSSLYRFNTVWTRIILYSLFDRHTYTSNGFKEHNVPSVLPTLKTIKHTDKVMEGKLHSLERIISKCKRHGVKLIVCFPPQYLEFIQQPIPSIAAVEELCKNQDIACYADYNDSLFLSHPELFWDNGHLNKNGASIYSQMMVSRLSK